MRAAIRALIIDAERELGTYREDDELFPCHYRRDCRHRWNV
jgi:hypothetical protein